MAGKMCYTCQKEKGLPLGAGRYRYGKRDSMEPVPRAGRKAQPRRTAGACGAAEHPRHSGGDQLHRYELCRLRHGGVFGGRGYRIGGTGRHYHLAFQRHGHVHCNRLLHPDCPAARRRTAAAGAVGHAAGYDGLHSNRAPFCCGGSGHQRIPAGLAGGRAGSVRRRIPLLLRSISSCAS